MNLSGISRYFQQVWYRLSHSNVQRSYILPVAVGLIAGTYLTVFHLLPRVFALNDTTKTWTFSAGTASQFTYDSTLVTVDNSGARPVTGVNKLTNPDFASNNASWTLHPVNGSTTPAGWTVVPGDSNYSGTTPAFLVMKYEAKCAATSDLTTGLISPTTGSNTYANSTTACTSANSRQVVSVASGYPIASISQTTSATYCTGVTVGGNAAHLITNNEWMAIARNAESVGANWTLGTVGSGYLFAGHNDNAPANARVASTTDTGNSRCAYTDTAGTTEAPSACPTNTSSGTSGTAGNQVRVLTLSNGMPLWDLSGNVLEWTNDTVTRLNQPVAWNGTTDDATGFNWSDYAVGSLARYIHTYKSGSVIQQNTSGPSNVAYNANQGIGRIYHYSNSADADTTVYGFLRGGYWTYGVYAGAFGLLLDSSPGATYSSIGFRCASDPVAISSSFSSSSGRVSGGNQISVGATLDGKFVQSVNVGDTNTYEFSAYVYDDTAGNVGGTVSSSIAELYYNGATIATTYSNAGSGWWKLTGTLTGANASREYGVLVKAGKTVTIDDFTLAKQGTYSVYTTTAYSNSQVVTWDSFSPTASGSHTASITYQLCTDDGSVCEAGSSWQYWDGNSWETASNTTTHTNTAAQLDQTAMQAINVTSQKLSVKAILNFGGSNTPALTALAVGLTTDTTTPPTNGSSVTMKRAIAGTAMSSNDWTSNVAPYFSWTAGSDNGGGSGIRGYCLYLGTDTAGDPATSKGLLGTSPGSTEGSTCQFVIASTSIDFATLAYRGSPWLTSSSSPYYLNLKAIDNGGNVFSGSSAQFQFRFDNTAPTNVAYISPAAGNFSNVVDMNFSWPTSGGSAASDSTAGILGWQYQINSTAGTWLGTTTDSALGLNYIPTSASSYTLTQPQDGSSIVSGNNVVYFRAVDAAGNLSSEATIRTGNLSYGGAAPAFEGAESVTITPVSATTNSFALSWPEAEASVGQSVTKYYYMVNTTPPSTLATLQGNTTTYIDNGTATTVAARSLPNVNKGSNTVYVVAIDDASTPNYSPSNYISGTFTLNSTDPDNVGNLVASDSSIKSQSQWNVTLTWTAPVYQGAGNLTYLVYRSSDGTTFAQVGTTSGLSYVDTTPSSAKYYYKIFTKDGANAQSSGSNAVAITPTGKFTSPPTLSSGPEAQSITTKKATIIWSTNRTSDSKVQYGTKSGEYGEVEPSNSSQTTSHSIQLTGLNPGTTYYYRAKWTDEDGNTGTSDEKSFSTAAAPTVKDITPTNVGLTSALIQFTTVGASKARVYYGTSTDFGGVKDIGTATSENTYSADLTGLEDGSKYYYKINLFDSEGSEYEGSILDFSTLPRPRITNVRLEQVANTAQTTVLVSWTTNTEISSIVSYYPQNNPSASQDAVKVALEKGAHSIIIRGLLPEEDYYLQVKGRDKAGNEAVSDIQRFTTATDTRAPAIINLKIIGGTVPPVGFAAGDIRAQLIVSWDTDEPATSQVEFGQGSDTSYSDKSQEDGNLTTNHTVILSNLTPSQVYHVRAVSKDSAGNQIQSVDMVTIAPKATRSALDLVMKNLSEAFSFLGAFKL